jgi:hypothetical protein
LRGPGALSADLEMPLLQSAVRPVFRGNNLPDAYLRSAGAAHELAPHG